MAAPVMQFGNRRGAVRGNTGGRVRGVHPPTAQQCAPVWDREIPAESPATVWLLGAHGGAGVSTLCRWIGRAGDARGAWPAGYGNQSPYVVLVAEESVTGLERAHELLRQYATGYASESAHLLGVVTVARLPGKRPQAVRQRRDLLSPLADALWSIPFVPGLNEYPLSDLPVWELGDEPTQKKRPSPREAVPAPVATFAADVMTTISAHLQARTHR